MQLGMIGLGRMGANLTRRLMRDGHDMVVWNRDPAPVATLAAEGAVGAESPAETALSMLAEIMAVRAGRDGGRLRESSGRIHAEVG